MQIGSLFSTCVIFQWCTPFGGAPPWGVHPLGGCTPLAHPKGVHPPRGRPRRRFTGHIGTLRFIDVASIGTGVHPLGVCARPDGVAQRGLNHQDDGAIARVSTDMFRKRNEHVFVCILSGKVMKMTKNGVKNPKRPWSR